MLGGSAAGGYATGGAAGSGLASMLGLNGDGNVLDDFMRMAGEAVR